MTDDRNAILIRALEASGSDREAKLARAILGDPQPAAPPRSEAEEEARWLKVRRSYYLGTVNPPKNGKPRDVPVSTGLARALWPLQGAPEALVFQNERGERVDRDTTGNAS
jgi:hypothetical protein